MHCVSRGGCYLVNAFCDLQEENQQKERYEACWLGLVLETRPQYRTTLSETDGVRQQRYEQQRVVHFLVQRSPDQTLTLGTGPTTETVTCHQLPLLRPRSTTDPHSARLHPKSLEGPKEPEPEGGEPDPDMKKPERMTFRPSGFMSSPREISHRVQKRE